MEKGLDTGPVALTARVTITPDMTAGALHDSLMLAGARLMREAMLKLEDGDLPVTPQPEEGVVYASKIDKGETRIDFSRSSLDVHNHIRGLSPFPGAWFELDIGGKPERVKVLESQVASGMGEAGSVLDDALTIACGSGALQLLRLQKAGAKPMLADDFLRGTKVSVGTRLG